MIQQTQAQRLADAVKAWAIAYTGTNFEEDMLLSAAAELRRLDQHERAHNVWLKKTEWVQDTVQPRELGMHRADVLRQRIKRLEALNAQLLEVLEELMYWDNGKPEYDDARAAIAAAKGEA